MKNDWKKIKVLIVGCGHIGKRHARILTSLGIEEIMAFDNNLKQLQALASELQNVQLVDSFEKGLVQADAVFILTPSKLHIPMAIQAINTDCHVFIEKPLSINMDGISELENWQTIRERR